MSATPTQPDNLADVRQYYATHLAPGTNFGTNFGLQGCLVYLGRALAKVDELQAERDVLWRENSEKEQQLLNVEAQRDAARASGKP